VRSLGESSEQGGTNHIITIIDCSHEIPDDKRRFRKIEQRGIAVVSNWEGQRMGRCSEMQRFVSAAREKGILACKISYSQS